MKTSSIQKSRPGLESTLSLRVWGTGTTSALAALQRMADESNETGRAYRLRATLKCLEDARDATRRERSFRLEARSAGNG